MSQENDPFAQPKASIMLLGVFHFFRHHSADVYEPKHGFDPLDAQRQSELEHLAHSLAQFQPTKIAIEQTQSAQTEIDSCYQAYLRGELELSADEIHQIGFRLAKMCGHSQISCVNAWDRYYAPAIDLEHFLVDHELQDVDALFEGQTPDIYAQQHGQTHLLSAWWPHYEAWLKRGDELTDQHTLQQTLLRINSEPEILKSHGGYLVDTFKIGMGHDYVGADWITHWFNRNLRIFANLIRITESPSERILLIIGSGHLPILRHCVQASPEYDLIEVSDYIRP